jgi:capsular exopolysaccharide synthesis family protein
MSRIHEALKRAEQDRQATHRDGTEKESSGQPPSGRMVLSDEPEASPVSAGVVEANLVTGSGSLRFEELRANCVAATWNPDPKRLLFTNSNPFASGAEQFRTLRSRLYRLRESQPLRRVLITSSIPAEGKSFVAANLAQVLVQQSGCRVLLIDADLRAPNLHKTLGAPLTPGLADYLQGGCSESEVMQRGTQEGLFFIPAGKHVTHPAELIASNKFKGLLDNVSDLFDWVILDSPPTVPVSDASVLAHMCDGVLFVVRGGSTPAEVCSKGCRELQNAPLIGVVLNAVKESGASDPYYGYGTTGYGLNVSAPTGKAS